MTPRACVIGVSLKQNEAAADAGYLLCPQCGEFYGGDRGLRTHQQIKHAQHYAVAMEAVQAAKQQVIAWTPPLAALLPSAGGEGAPQAGAHQA